MKKKRPDGCRKSLRLDEHGFLDITIGSYVLMYFKNNTPGKID